ncbi:MAG: (Fe-S)-binding protein [Actinomycetota bacterium]|nr:(Fe-S)-binding protein [Actinomycetota bacterium]
MLIKDYELELFSPPCDPGSPVWVARVKTDADLAPVMPYVNAVARNAFYDPTIVWREGAHKYALRDNVISINNLKDRAHAERTARKAVERINQIWERREEITPDHTMRVPPKLLDILRHLPRTNCGKCGVPTCMAFAAQLVEGERCVEDCPPLLEAGMEEKLEKLRELGL